MKLDRKAIATDEFKHQADAFRSWVSVDNTSPFPLAQGRYHLYISLACPWASRTFIVRKLKHLEQAIGVTVADPIRDERGWAFRDGPGFSRDPINGFQFLSEAYLATDAQYSGRVSPCFGVRLTVLPHDGRDRLVEERQVELLNVHEFELGVGARGRLRGA